MSGQAATVRTGREHRLVDLHDAPALPALADDADVIIEASRPRALRALGLDAARWLAAGPGPIVLCRRDRGSADRVAGGP